MQRLRLTVNAFGLLTFFLVTCRTCSASTRSTSTMFTLLDQSGTGSIRVPSTKLPSAAVITSPGTKDCFYDFDGDLAAVLVCDDSHLICRGAQLGGTSDPERTALATTSLVASVILVDGITQGDVQDLANSRHARTLTALFRARLLLAVEEAPQTLILGVQGDLSADQHRLVLTAVNMLFEAAAIERKHSKSFQDLYSVQIVNVKARDQAQEVRYCCLALCMTFERRQAIVVYHGPRLLFETNKSNFAKQALDAASRAAPPAAFTLSYAYSQVLESKVGSAALDPPFMAQEFVRVGNSLQKCLRTLRARIAVMESRVSRGLWMESFGAQADLLEKKIAAFDSETLSAAGLPLVAPYRHELRRQLKTFVDTAITELFEKQIENLSKSALKRFTKQLVQNMKSEESADLNAAALRKESFYFETVVEELQVPALGLTKQKEVREMASLLNDALQTFADSSAAKIARAKRTERVVNRQRKPSQPAFDIGLDLVAVLRPDGFGSLQGFCGYNWRGNSLTLGIHNDADDPQVIAQFGGVRPPLLRVQPKLRVDVEL